jgi:hypothetical protein
MDGLSCVRCRAIDVRSFLVRRTYQTLLELLKMPFKNV